MRSLSAALGSAVLCLPGAALSYVDGPVADRDGGGAQTCRECHTHDESLTADGTIELTGLPDAYEPGRIYHLTLRLSHPGMERAGFQMSIRTEDGSQAGELASLDPGVKISPDEKEGIIFAQHSEDGAPFVHNGRHTWSVEWIAPMDGESVNVYAAGNASNGDDSALGDVILLFNRELEKARGAR